MRKTLLALLITLAAQSFGWSQEVAHSQPDRTRVLPDMTEGVQPEGAIIFTYVDQKHRRRLTLDLYRPVDGDGPFPAIVMYFGGGWQNGRPGLFAPLAQALAQRGYVCVVPEYRLSGEAPFPAAIHDAKAAIRWTRKHAQRFRINPDRIACLGGSAGGHIAGFMAATNGVERFEGSGDHRDVSSDVQAAVVMCGAMDLLEATIVERVERAAKTLEGDAVIDFLGGAIPSVDESIYREGSPLTHVSRRTPPMLFIDGEFDRPRDRYTGFWEKLDEHRIPHEFILMPQGPHPFWNMREWFEPTVEAVDRFLQEHLTE